MENKQFERNRYYVGKLLTSLDFQTEQSYLNEKRHFLNQMLFGDGIVCGLGVYNLDDTSVMVESGAALDSRGRELVLEKSLVRRLSAIDGFESLESEHVCLCLRYFEEPVRPVYAVNRQDGEEEYELNHIREGVQLFLADAETLAESEPPESDFLSRLPLYRDDDYSVELTIPACVPCGQRVKLCIAAEKLSSHPVLFSMDCALQIPAFVSETGGHEISLSVKDASAEKGGRILCEAWLTAQAHPTDDSVIIAGAGGTLFQVGDTVVCPSENRTVKVAIEALSPDEIITREIGKISLENRRSIAKSDYVRLADFILQRSQNLCVIEKMIETGVKKYVSVSADEALRREYAAYYEPPTAFSSVSVREAPANKVLNCREPLYATGVCEIPLEPPTKSGYVYYSDEIMHGLGKGDVYVTAGFEYLAEDPTATATQKSTIYGVSGLFDDELPVRAETAVKVLNDRGSFVAAALLTHDTNEVLLVLRWVAIKLPAAADPLESALNGKSIAAVQPTTVLAARESRYFSVKFYNMQPCTLTYELTEKGSGKITSDGIYTAPAQEGVYEIKISCTDEPSISTYAYAVVKKMDAEDAPQPE